jgi:hypothetical protein
MKKVHRVVSLVLSIVAIICLVFQIGFGIFAAYQMNAMDDAMNAVDDTLRSQHELANQQFDKFIDKNKSTTKRSDFVVKQQSQSVEKESDVECVTYDQFMNLDAYKASKAVFEKSTNGVTIWCRKKKEQQSVKEEPECLTYDQFMNLDAESRTLFEKSAWCRKKKEQQSVKKEPECLTFEQFMNLDAESKTLFEKSANGLTMCRKKKEEQSPNDAQKSEGQP